MLSKNIIKKYNLKRMYIIGSCEMSSLPRLDNLKIAILV